jgi:osmoprotectant transport system permease protein
VGALIGIGGLGGLFTDGYQRNIPSEIVTGIVLIVLLAFVSDSLLLAVGRFATPWERANRGARRSRV